MKNKKNIKQISILIAIVVILASVFLACSSSSESDSNTGMCAECIGCTIVGPTACASYCAACACDECVYYVTCGGCDLNCKGCVEDCGSCIAGCLDCAGCANLGN